MTMYNVEMPNSPAIEEIAPNNLVSVFDISGLVDYPVSNKLEYPPLVALYENNISFKVYIGIGEIWTDENGDRQESFVTPATNNLIKILKGKLRPYDLARQNKYETNFDTSWIQVGAFLTNLPNFFKVLPDHKPLLWFQSPWPDSKEIVMNEKIYCTDPDQDVTLTEVHTIYDITGLVALCMQPYFWKGFETTNGARIISYECWLSWEGGQSDHRTFVVDYTYYEKPFTFYYLNQISGIDLIWFTGEHTQSLRTEAETMYKPVPFGSGVNTASLTTISASGQRKWELNTGIKNREDLLAMRDFLESKERWMIDQDDNDLLIPVIVEAGDFKLFDSMEDIQSIDLVILEAHK